MGLKTIKKGTIQYKTSGIWYDYKMGTLPMPAIQLPLVQKFAPSIVDVDYFTYALCDDDLALAIVKGFDVLAESGLPWNGTFLTDCSSTSTEDILFPIDEFGPEPTKRVWSGKNTILPVYRTTGGRYRRYLAHVREYRPGATAADAAAIGAIALPRILRQRDLDSGGTTQDYGWKIYINAFAPYIFLANLRRELPFLVPPSGKPSRQ